MSWNSAGRKKNDAWNRFTIITQTENGKEVTKQMCNGCKTVVSNRIERIKTHLQKCSIER